MAFDVKEFTESSELVEINERLWLAADGETVVADGDPDAASLLAAEGSRMSRAEAERYGLVKARSSSAANKQRSEPAANKAAAPAATDAAAKLASDEGVDLASISGTGADGRITKEDVEKASTARNEAK